MLSNEHINIINSLSNNFINNILVDLNTKMIASVIKNIIATKYNTINFLNFDKGPFITGDSLEHIKSEFEIMSETDQILTFLYSKNIIRNLQNINSSDNDLKIHIRDIGRYKNILKVIDLLEEKNLACVEFFPLIDKALQQHEKHIVRTIKIQNCVTIYTNENNPILINKLLATSPILTGLSSKMTQEQKDILSNLDSEKLNEELIVKYLEKEKKEVEKIRLKELSKILDVNHEKEIRKLEDSKSYSINELNHYYREIENTLNKIKQLDIYLLGYLNNTDNNDEKTKELYDFLNTNKAITEYNIQKNNRTNSYVLYLTIETPVRFYDPEMLLAYEKKWAYENDEQKIFIKILKKIFVEKKYTLFFGAQVEINTEQYGNGIINRASYNITQEKHSLPNPHIHYYNCFGGNSHLITKEIIENNDYITGISQIIASISNINFTDTTVFRRFFTELNINDDSKLTKIKAIQDNETKEFISYKELKDIVTKEEF